MTQPDRLRVCGLVLAAGASRRMRRPKALLPIDGETFVARVIRTMAQAGVADVAVITRPEDQALVTEVAAALPGAVCVPNPHPDRGQLSSLIVGLDRADAIGAGAVLVMPVDMPLVAAASMRLVLEGAARTTAPVVRAVHGGRRGHPVLFRAAMFPRLRRAGPDRGASHVIAEVSALVRDVEVDDAAVLRDVDDPEEYRAAFGRDPW